jgi:hypothetical protein
MILEGFDVKVKGYLHILNYEEGSLVGCDVIVWKKSTDVFSGFNHNPATIILQFSRLLLFFFITSKL